MNDLILSYNKLIITNTLSLPKSLIKKEKKRFSQQKNDTLTKTGVSNYFEFVDLL